MVVMNTLHWAIIVLRYALNTVLFCLLLMKSEDQSVIAVTHVSFRYSLVKKTYLNINSCYALCN